MFVCGSAADIVKRSGILRGQASSTEAPNGTDQANSVPGALQDAVDYAMRRLASYLLTGERLHRPCCRASQQLDYQQSGMSTGIHIVQRIIMQV